MKNLTLQFAEIISRPVWMNSAGRLMLSHPTLVKDWGAGVGVGAGAEGFFHAWTSLS